MKQNSSERTTNIDRRKRHNRYLRAARRSHGKNAEKLTLGTNPRLMCIAGCFHVSKMTQSNMNSDTSQGILPLRYHDTRRLRLRTAFQRHSQEHRVLHLAVDSYCQLTDNGHVGCKHTNSEGNSSGVMNF